MKPPETSKIHDAEASVYQRYAAAAQATEPALCCPVEYAADFLTLIPDEIIERDYGCGDPTPFVQPGDTVLDLGSGAGKLCYIAAQVTGAKGRVIGIDCNQEMLSLAGKHIETRNWQETTCKTETRKDNAIACFSQTKAVVHRCS